MVLRFLLALALMLSTASALVVGSPRVVTRSGAASLSMGIAAFRTGDKVQVITGADKGAVGKVRAATQLLARPAAALRARALAPRAIFKVWAARRTQVISVDRKKGKVTVEGVNIRSKHMKPMKEGETGRIMKREARHAAHARPPPRRSSRRTSSPPSPARRRSRSTSRTSPPSTATMTMPSRGPTGR